FPNVRMRIGPARQLACHLRLGGYRAIHSHRTERPEQRAVKQGSPACKENARGPGRHVDQTPDAHILVVRPTAIVQRTVDYLRLKPQRPTSGLRVPEWFSTRSGTCQIDRVKLHPGRVAMTRGDPGVSVRFDFGCVAPRNLAQSSDTMRRDLISLVGPAKEFRPPTQEADRIVPPEFQPVEIIGIRAAARRLYVAPRGEAIAVPHPRERFDCAVLCSEPLAVLRLAG